MGDSSQCFSLQARIPLGKPHTLVVDDDDSVRDLYQRMLNRHGYKVTVVSGGQEALDFLAAQKVDLMLLDVRMPDTRASRQGRDCVPVSTVGQTRRGDACASDGVYT